MKQGHPRSEPSLAETIRGYAGLAAVILGVVYVYGALIKATQLHGAHQSITDTLPLVPLDQVLLAGINASLLLIAVALFTVLVILVVQEARERKGPEAQTGDDEESDRADRHQSETTRKPLVTWFRRHFRAIMYPILVLGWSFILLVSPPSMIVTVTYLAVLLWWRWPPHISRQRWALVGAVLFICVTLAQNYLNPVPLPKAILVKQDGGTVRGDLLVSTASTWYIGTDDHQFTAVQSAAIKTADVEAQKREDESVFEKLTGEKLLGLPKD